MGRRVRRDQLGELILEVDELPVEPVVLGVGDLGLVFQVIEPVVTLYLCTKLLDLLRRFLLRKLLSHAAIFSTSTETSPPDACAVRAVPPPASASSRAALLNVPVLNVSRLNVPRWNVPRLNEMVPNRAARA